jgi:hypothetical protein
VSMFRLAAGSTNLPVAALRDVTPKRLAKPAGKPSGTPPGKAAGKPAKPTPKQLAQARHGDQAEDEWEEF